MKKRLWLPLVPLLLLGAVFLVREAAWKKTEADFRQDVKSWTAEVPTIHLFVQNSKQHFRFQDEPGNLWNTPDFLSLTEEICLARARSFPKPFSSSSVLSAEPLIFVSLNDGGTVGEPFGFYLSLKEDRGWMDIPISSGQDGTANWKDKGYELAPQTCRNWKRHIFSLRENQDGELVAPSK